MATTPSWAYHPRGPGWLLVCLSLVAVALVTARRSSLVAAFAAGIMAGGLLGNVLSASWNDLRVPDPIIVFSRHGGIAFNLADVFTTVGILALTTMIAHALVRNRHLVATREEARAAVRRVTQRRG
jgi:lipoprotein signal peptidase